MSPTFIANSDGTSARNVDSPASNGNGTGRRGRGRDVASLKVKRGGEF